MSADNATKKTTPIRGGPFTINLLNRIFGFAASSAADLVLKLAPVCKQWQETELMYSADSWERVSKKKWGASLRGRRWSHFSYERRAKSLIRSARLTHELAEIEGCVDDATAAAEDDSVSGPLPFSFRCPMIAANLRVLEDEYMPKSDLNILFCDVCEKKVYPCVSQEEVNDQATRGRCVLIPAGAALQQKKARELKKKMSPAAHDDSGADAALISSPSSLTDRLMNIVVVTTAPAPGRERRHQQQNLFGPDDDRAQLLLKLIARETEDQSIFDGEKCEQYPKKATAASAFPSFIKTSSEQQEDQQQQQRAAQRFLSSELLMVSFFGPDINESFRFVLRIVRVPSPPEDFSPSNAQEDRFVALHPCSPGNPLDEASHPAINGWNKIVAADELAERWFHPYCIPKKAANGGGGRKMLAIVSGGGEQHGGGFLNYFKDQQALKRKLLEVEEAGGFGNRKKKTQREVKVQELANKVVRAMKHEIERLQDDLFGPEMGEMVQQPPPEDEKKCVVA